MKALAWIIGVLVGGFLLLLIGGLMMPSLDERVQKAKASGYTSVELYASEEAAVRNGVSAALKDPASAQFGSMRAYFDDQDRVIVCGTVNAHNSFGGYIGEVSYMGMLKNDIFLPGAIDTATSDLAGGICRTNESKRIDALVASANALIGKKPVKTHDNVDHESSAKWDAVVVKK